MARRPSRYAKGVARGRAYRKSGTYPLRHNYGKTANPSAATIQAVVRRAVAKSVNKNIETKTANNTSADGSEILHNNCITLTDQLLYTTQGITDPATGATACRIGDAINLKGVSIKMMVELNERYSDVTFRLMVIKCARGDVPNRANLFVGLSGNKMLDRFNNERYTIISQKYFKITAPNQSTFGPLAVPILAGVNAANDAVQTMSRATRIVKLWIKGSKFVRSGVITYDNGGFQPKFFDYHVVLYSYSNYSTSQDLYYTGRVNDYISTLYYKDA